MLKDHLADHEVAGQPGRILHEYDLHPVGLDAIKQGGQAGAIVEILRAGYAGITELSYYIKSVLLRVLGDRRGLAVPGIPVHLAEPTASEIADGLGGSLGFHGPSVSLKVSFTTGIQGRNAPRRHYFHGISDGIAGQGRVSGLFPEVYEGGALRPLEPAWESEVESS